MSSQDDIQGELDGKGNDRDGIAADSAATRIDSLRERLAKRRRKSGEAVAASFFAPTDLAKPEMLQKQDEPATSRHEHSEAGAAVQPVQPAHAPKRDVISLQATSVKQLRMRVVSQMLVALRENWTSCSLRSVSAADWVPPAASNGKA